MTTIIDGTAGVTFPAGSNPQAAPSKVLQVVYVANNTQTSTTSTTPVSAGFSASITPLFATSKILLLLNFAVGSTLNNSYTSVQLWRGGSSIFNFAPVACYLNSGSSVTQLNMTVSETYLDSPATTSSISYTPYYSTSTGGLAYLAINNNFCTITLMEIAA